MRDYEQRREDRRKYENDVFYDVWRSGGNPDRIDYDRVRDDFYEGLDAEDCAAAELRRMRPKQEMEMEMEPEGRDDGEA